MSKTAKREVSNLTKAGILLAFDVAILAVTTGSL